MAVNEDEADEFAFNHQEEEEGGEQALAVKPFLGELRASTPSGYKASRNSSQAPDGNLRLKHAHGFRCHDTRGNLKYARGGGRIVYTTAALGVVQEKASREQEFFDLH